MLNMSQQITIREMGSRGFTVTEISRDLGLDPKTVRKYLAIEDFSPTLPEVHKNPSKLDPYKPVIDEWLVEDEKVFYKQRHTARRIKRRLEEEHGFKCGLTTIQSYLKEARDKKKARTSLDLVWLPGYAQADFGEADCFIDGEQMRMHYLVLTFPYSNVGYCQFFFGESAECVCQGLKDIFAHIQGIPLVIVFDNGTGIGKKLKDAVYETELFKRFRMHYRFEARFTNTAAGWEKGSAERKVALLRTELMVPAPVFTDIVAFNEELLSRCSFQLAERHYAKGKRQGDLFGQDVDALSTLPAKEFNAVRYEYLTADGYGHITLDTCHLYSASPDMARRELAVGIGAHSIDIFDAAGEAIASHRRRFGKKRTESIDPVSQIRLLARRPGGWKNTRLRTEMPMVIVEHLDSLDKDALRRDLATLYESCERSGYDSTMRALEMLSEEHERFPDFFSVSVLAARIFDLGLDTEPLGGADLACYDAFMTGGDV